MQHRAVPRISGINLDSVSRDVVGAAREGAGVITTGEEGSAESSGGHRMSVNVVSAGRWPGARRT
jgi:hypothetical protein